MALTPPDEAWQRLETYLEPLAPERVVRRDAVGRVLAEPLESTVDVPANDVSAMDGYAVGVEVAAGASLPVAGVVAAGDAPGFDLPSTAAARIMTGAPCPQSAVSVVPVEATDNGDESVRFEAPSGVGRHIRRKGEILRVGEPLLTPGAALTPGALSLLASHGYADLAVHSRPSVAFLTTGDEVVPPEIEPGPGQLRDSHTDFLLAAGAGLGLTFRHLGIAPDQPEVLEEMISAGLEADVLLVCGGVSMGEFDFVEAALERLGCDVLFDAVAVQPGKPLVAARHANGWLFGLPGNPASVMVTFWLFVQPLLRRLMGHPDRYLGNLMTGTLVGETPGARDRDRYLPAEIRSTENGLEVTPVAPKGSHDQLAYARGTALLRVPAGAAPGRTGDPCQVLPFG